MIAERTRQSPSVIVGLVSQPHSPTADSRKLTAGNEQLKTPLILREALARATAQLDASPTLRDSASRDALLLLLHTLGISRAEFYADPTRILTPNQQAAYESLILRRLTNEPIQYITAEQEFYGLTLHVTPAVLIPRPETEELVGLAFDELIQRRVTEPLIVDLGCGSGAI